MRLYEITSMQQIAQDALNTYKNHREIKPIIRAYQQYGPNFHKFLEVLAQEFQQHEYYQDWKGFNQFKQNIKHYLDKLYTNKPYYDELSTALL